MSLFEGIKLVSWDCDGTLYSLRRLKLRLVRHALSPRSGLRVRDLRAIVLHHRALDAMRGGPIHLDAMLPFEGITRLEQRWFDYVISRIGPSRQALRLLNQAQQLNITQVVLSDMATPVTVGALGLLPYFSAVYTGHALGMLKPDPRFFVHVQRAHGVQAHEHLHIGDRLECDGRGAELSGARFLHLVG